MDIKSIQLAKYLITQKKTSKKFIRKKPINFKTHKTD